MSRACRVCRRVYDVPSDLVVHARQEHGEVLTVTFPESSREPAGSWICSACGELFPRWEEYAEHELEPGPTHNFRRLGGRSRLGAPAFPLA